MSELEAPHHPASTGCAVQYCDCSSCCLPVCALVLSYDHWLEGGGAGRDLLAAATPRPAPKPLLTLHSSPNFGVL